MTHLYLVLHPVSLDEAADRSGLAVSTIREHLRSGVLQGTSISGQMAVAEDSLLRLLIVLEQRRAKKAARDKLRRKPVLRLAWTNPNR